MSSARTERLGVVTKPGGGLAALIQGKCCRATPFDHPLLPIVGVQGGVGNAGLGRNAQVHHGPIEQRPPGGHSGVVEGVGIVRHDTPLFSGVCATAPPAALAPPPFGLRSAAPHVVAALGPLFHP